MVRIKTWVIEKLGAYVGRILKGEKPADMLVQQATKTRLVYQSQNSKSAGLTVPVALVARADEVIE